MVLSTDEMLLELSGECGCRASTRSSHGRMNIDGCILKGQIDATNALSEVLIAGLTIFCVWNLSQVSCAFGSKVFAGLVRCEMVLVTASIAWAILRQCLFGDKESSRFGFV
jgi:hypothetical protein